MNNTAKIEKSVLPALILITPFLVFLDYNSYCFGCPETWLALGGLILLGVILSVVMLLGGGKVSALVMALIIPAFVDLQFSNHSAEWFAEWAAILLFTGMQTFVLCLFLKEKFYMIATAVFSTFFVVTVFQVVLPSNNTDSFFGHGQEPAAHAPPRIIHLILDEHIGIEGIPTDIEGGLAVKNLIKNFYLKNGFQLFGGAFSRFLRSHNSMGSMLNFTADSGSVKFTAGTGPYVLLRNRYFELLSERQYAIDALSPGWLDYCTRSIAVTNRCVERNWRNLRNFAKLALPISQKLEVLYSRFLNQSTIMAVIIAEFVSPFESHYLTLAPSVSHVIWALDQERTKTDSLNTLIDLKILWRDILSLSRGRALFAHLTLPHYPYTALSDCSIRPPQRYFLWNNNGMFDYPANTVASRRERYQQYFEQLRCIYLRLDELFDQMRAAGIYDDSIILLHGDHGSRIFMTAPIPINQQALRKQDLVDGFSSLFAMKLPGKPGGYDKSPWPLEQLLARFVYETSLTPNHLLPGKAESFVYLTADDEEFIRVPYRPPD